tara:strand:- start:322 stop:588 length:267 start_codon:yes stop_codon:yes gene_type:complete
MTTYEQKNNSGSLFKNDRKETDNHPDYNGSCLVNGSEMWMSAWLKTSASGKKFMSFSFKSKEGETYVPKTQPISRASQKLANDDDVPF